MQKLFIVPAMQHGRCVKLLFRYFLAQKNEGKQRNNQ